MLKMWPRHLGCDAVELLPYEYLLTNLVKKKLIALDNDSIQKANFHPIGSGKM
jgi:hypothetical protein